MARACTPTLRSARRIALAVALVALAVPSAAGAVTGSPNRAKAADDCPYADVIPTEANLDRARAGTLCLMNAQRAAHGLRALRSEPTLGDVAGRFARRMATERFFDHTAPDGSTLLSRVKGSSYLRRTADWSIGENLAWGTGRLSTPRATVKAWMASPPHRANLLASQFTEVGIGLAVGAASADIDPGQPGGTYVTDFGRRTVRATAAGGRQ